jgi:hypothetical protein
MAKHLARDQATASSELLQENELSRTPLSGFTVTEIEAHCGISPQVIDTVTTASGDIPLETSKVRSCQRSLDDACKLLDTLEKRLVVATEYVRESAVRREDRIGMPVEYLDQLCLRDLARDLRERAARVAELTENLSHAVPRIPDDTPEVEGSAPNTPALEPTDITEFPPCAPDNESRGEAEEPVIPVTNSPFPPPPPPPQIPPPPEEQKPLLSTTIPPKTPHSLPLSPSIVPPPPPAQHEIKSNTPAVTSVSQLHLPSHLNLPIDDTSKSHSTAQILGQTVDVRPTGQDSTPRARYPSKFRRSRIP